MAVTRSLVVKVTCAQGDPERANQAFTVAAAAVAAGAPVSLWLTGDAVLAGVRPSVPGALLDLGLEHATPLAALLEVVLEDGTVTVCTQCATRRGLVEGDLRPGVRLAGAALFADEVLADGVQALVY